ncbi:MAG: DUF4446 family protein [Candidatus Paceibacterota bacterium]
MKSKKQKEKIQNLEDAAKRIEALEEVLKNALEKINELEKKSIFYFQKFNLIRYNPFENRGGDQSFSLAMLDQKNNGFVVTSIFMDGNTRIFAKPIEKGLSKYQLSKEEQQAIEGVKQD